MNKKAENSNLFFWRGFLLSMLFFGIFFTAGSAVAQNEKVVSSGTLVSAAFETMGYAAQQQVLQDMSEQIGKVAGLIYLGVLVSAILTVGLMGNYAAGLWLVVGPTIFIFVSGVSMNNMDNRIDAEVPEWRFGAFEDDQGLKDKFTKGIINQANVSFVFHKYNELISELYQKLISEITSGDIENQMLFMARQRMIEELYGLEIKNPETKTLVGYMLFLCPNELTDAQKVAAIKRDPGKANEPGYEKATEKYCGNFQKKNKRLENRQLGTYLREVLNVPYGDGDLVSCHDLWNWSLMGLKKDVASGLEQTINFVFGPEIVGAYGSAIINKALDSIKQKLQTPRDGAQTGVDPCPFAGPADQGIEGGESFKALVNIFSGMVMRKNQTSMVDKTALQQVYSGRYSSFRPSDESFGRSANSDKDAQRRRDRAIELGVTNQYEAFHTVMLLPYLQAILLYVLSVMYPFFALMIIIPGQASNFFTWMALWAWVKSWDVGWALVMVTDKLLYEIMPHQTFYDPNASSFTPVSLMEMHFDGDFAYSAAFYWVVLALMVGAVPVITAQIILGSKRAIASAILRGVTDISSRMSAPASNWYRMKAVRDVTAQREQEQFWALVSKMFESVKGINRAGDQAENDNPNLRKTLEPANKTNMSEEEGRKAGSRGANVEAVRPHGQGFSSWLGFGK